MSWLHAPVARARIAWLRILVYAVVIFDVLVNVTDPIAHGDVPPDLYHPVLARQVLLLPAPTPLHVEVLRVVILVGAVVAASGRLPRLAGGIVAIGMIDWLSNAFSYSKIDHDHFALVVALCVLPTVGAASIRDVGPEHRSQAAGWACRMIQIAAVASYFLAALAKIRFGGWGWASGATFVWAFSRRGNDVAQWLAGHPLMVQASQWGVLLLELLSPLLLRLRGRGLAIGLGICFAFHASTEYLLRIHFLPLVVCLFAFVPLERLWPWWEERRARRVAGGRPAAA